MITVGQLLDVAPMQDVYILRQYKGCDEEYKYAEEIPKELNNKTVMKVYGFNAQGYDGLEVVYLWF